MHYRLFAGLLLLAVLIGCSPSKPAGELPALHPVTGKVMRGGNPVSGGLVRFHADPEDTNIVTNGEVKSDGTFELQTLHALSQKKGAGAPAGTYSVTYFPPLGDQTAGPNPEPVQLREKVTVKEGANDLTLSLGKK